MKNKCPHCGKGKLVIVEGYEPYTEEHYQCDNCDSTYTLEVIENAKIRQNRTRR